MTRWFQYGTFLPTLRLHGDRKEAEIWSFGKQAETVMARFDTLRYQLIPYIYSQAKFTHDTGAPFMRALWMDFPNDPNVANIGTQYMFGPAFLVAPVTEQGQTEKDVYLPAGSDWYNYWTNEKLSGGRWVKVAAPIDQIPVFVRAGSVVPIGAEVQSTATRQAIAEVKVYPGKDGEFQLYDDDGVSYDYEKGKSSITTLKWNDASGKLSVVGGDAGLAKSVKIIGK
jgi:alpha-D-xyloside xylohydrolase